MSQVVNLLGRRFGKLVVIKEAGSNSYGRKQWLCQCDCGNTTVVSGNTLTQGRVKTCGCSKKVNLTGCRFGKLIVVEEIVQRDDYGKVLWRCQCDCGETRLVRTSELLRGEVTSCGCARRVDLQGLQFGRLKVLYYAGPGDRGRAMWRCLCSCGNECTIGALELQRGTTKSCGCLHSEIVAQLRYKHGGAGTRLYRIWNQMWQRCTNPRNNAFGDYGKCGITVCSEWSEFIDFQSWATTAGYNDALSIDRINPFRDYCPDNCRWSDTHTQANNKRYIFIKLANNLSLDFLACGKFTTVYDLMLEYLQITLDDVVAILFKAVPYKYLGSIHIRDPGLCGFVTAEALIEEIVWKFVTAYCDYVFACIAVYQGGSADLVSQDIWLPLKKFSIDVSFTLDDFHKVMCKHFS